MAPLIDNDTVKIGAPGIAGIIVGSVAFVAFVVVSVCLVARRRSRQRAERAPPKQFLLPKDVRPVISFKTAAGPGGLKKSPSPISSPDNPDQSHQEQWKRVGSEQQQSGNKGTDEMRMDGEMDELVGGKVATDGNANEVSSEDNNGYLNFNVCYKFEQNALVVNIIGASSLRAKPRPLTPGSGSEVCSPSEDSVLNPYVKLQLLPEKQHKVKTRVVRNTLNPVYDEEFTFYGLNYNQLQSTTLHYAVIGFDRYSRDEIVGEVICPLHSIDLSDSSKLAQLSMPLVNRSLKFKNCEERGELLCSLCYQPATNKLTAVVLKARNLPKVDITGMCDPYVKVYLLYDGQRVAKKKSHVKKRTLNPVYNESFVFELPVSGDAAALSKLSLELLVMDWDRLTKNEVMGRCEIGSRARGGTGKQHWADVCSQPRKQIAEWYKLRP